MKHKVLDLFSGIGGFSLGLERTGGFETVAFCEIDKFCQKILKKHWADVPIYNDIKELTNDRLEADGIVPTVITAGFPCTDLSQANPHGKELDGEKSGLFFEIGRLVRQIRPAYFIVENVTTLLANKNFGRILGEFSKIGNYVVEWHCVSASQIGAPHKRNRVWIIGRNTNSNSKPTMPINDETFGLQKYGGNECGTHISDTIGKGLQRHRKGLEKPSQVRTQETTRLLCGVFGSDFWKSESCLRTVVDGVPERVAKLKAIGNSLVPQIPEMIGNAILEHERINANETR